MVRPDSPEIEVRPHADKLNALPIDLRFNKEFKSLKEQLITVIVKSFPIDHKLLKPSRFKSDLLLSINKSSPMNVSSLNPVIVCKFEFL